MKCKNCNHNRKYVFLHDPYNSEYSYSCLKDCSCDVAQPKLEDEKVECQHLEKYEFTNYVQAGTNCRFFGYLLGGSLQPQHSMKIPFWFCPLCGVELKKSKGENKYAKEYSKFIEELNKGETK